LYFVGLAYFLCVSQTKLAGGRTVFSSCPSVLPSMFVRLSVIKLVKTTFWKRMNRFRCRLSGSNKWSAEQGQETINIGARGGNVRRGKILMVWPRHHFRPTWDE